MHLHILGICGTFMGGVAALAKAAGHRVTGSDENVYPPMSTQLEILGIDVMQGFAKEHLEPAPDCVVIGNVLSRGNPAVEHVLSSGLPYVSGPEWLARHVLADRWVLAVAGTHGKTTTASILAWILEYAGLNPGFLIGGVPGNFDTTARFGEPPFFVVEADEYDCAFFDKRAKFVHYRPRTLVLNNLEFDHADIYADLDAIKTQFHHLVRTVPGNGKIVANADDKNLADVLKTGCWTAVEQFGGAPGEGRHTVDTTGAGVTVTVDGNPEGPLEWSMVGSHNVENALAAMAAARHAGVPTATSLEALKTFRGVKRRLEVRACVNDITVYDDFAHHPTAIARTLDGVRRRIGDSRLVAVLEPRSNTMKMGVHRNTLGKALADADAAWIFQPATLGWNLDEAAAILEDRLTVSDDVETMADGLAAELMPGDHVVIMSNGGFGGLHDRLIQRLQLRADSNR